MDIVAEAIANPVLSRHHEFSDRQQTEYNSLKARGRTLYDTLRTTYDYNHEAAFILARREFGTKEF